MSAEGKQPAISFGYEVEEIDFLGNRFELVPLTEKLIADMAVLETRKDERVEKARAAAAELEGEDGAAELSEEQIRERVSTTLNVAVETIAEILDLRTKPVASAKKTLGARVLSEWKSGSIGFDQIARFSAQVADIDPFGE